MSKGRILCTEDDADTRDLIILTLRFAGYDVKCADNSGEAIDLLTKEKFDLCLLDNWLPGTSGVDVCERIRQFDAKTPILFYSGASQDADKERAFKAGAQGYLVKPVLADDLIGEVSRLLDHCDSEQTVENLFV
jgi:two-component system OmpR family response regulator